MQKLKRWNNQQCQKNALKKNIQLNKNKPTTETQRIGAQRIGEENKTKEEKKKNQTTYTIVNSRSHGNITSKRFLTIHCIF